jgi:superfamily II DNA/RNA helicase
VNKLTNFENIGFSPELKNAIKKMGYKQATEVQEKSIPLMISGQNVVSKSFTGSGKTAAFGIALSERILKGQSRGALVVCPTRELALQVKEELRNINSETGLQVFAVYGGTKMSRDEKIFNKRIDILCATPGRLLDHFERRRLDPKIFDTVVLDEADRMLDMGFIRDIRHVLSFVRPKNTHLFSATLTGEVARLIESYIPKFKEVMVQEEIVGKNILQKKQSFSREQKYELLVNWLKKAGNQRVLVFVSTKHFADSLSRRLNRDGFRAETIHGDKRQAARETALNMFKKGQKNILIATDVAARGLQISNVEFVINLDRARDADTHKHRIGRTGRMGDVGHAITFIPAEDRNKDFWKDPGINYKQFSKNGPRKSFSHGKRHSRSRDPRRRSRPRRNDDVADYIYRV